MKKILKRLSVVFVFLFIIVFIAINNIAPYAIIQPPKINENSSPEKLGLNYEKQEIESFDGIKLNGYWIKTDQEKVKGIIIFVHGIGGCKEHFLGLAKELKKVGIESIAIDNRAHGESGGQYCTFGAKEKMDISAIINSIKTKNAEIPIGIWGNSLGGAIAIQSLAYDERLKFGIIESTFTDLSQIVFDYKTRVLKGFGSKLLSDYALKRAGQIGDFNPNDVKPIQRVQEIEQPVFLAHGDADENISYKYGVALFENLKTEHKTFFSVKGGGHTNLFDKGGTVYRDSIMTFINHNLRE